MTHQQLTKTPPTIYKTCFTTAVRKHTTSTKELPNYMKVHKNNYTLYADISCK